MQRVKLPTFYAFGRIMSQLKVIGSRDSIGDQAVMRVIFAAHIWLQFFLNEIRDVSLPNTRDSAQGLSDLLGEYSPRVAAALKATKPGGAMETLGDIFVQRVNEQVDEFETIFKRESKRVSIFAVTRKGIYDTEALIEEGEKKFPPELLAVMPAKVIEDVQEASRCLAFERGTACAFHICRATEGLMRAYYKKLTGDEWPPPPPKPKMNRDWHTLVSQLKVEGAPKKIIERLGELREDRNSYAHPDVTVPIDEAPIVYETCTFAMFYIAKEML